MTQPQPAPQGFILSPQEIISTLFRHKWKILFFSFLGFAAHGGVFTLKKPPYQSTARLLIRYVTDKRSSSRWPKYTQRRKSVLRIPTEIRWLILRFRF
jgi:uncharacterized protein involved in exopolysaccharide biosynthesis